ncbi:MAG TPA: hypothetical protein VHD91_06740 [Gaiellaceae bacterium]|nr:hypothetical protein [Gaiellaceae bacterium]
MHHHGHHHGPPFGRRRLFGRPFPSREELIDRLESHQRDLEQELANLDDVLRHLRGSESSPQQPAEV